MNHTFGVLGFTS